MKIVLVRHAKVLLSKHETMYASEMKAWINAYDKVAIDETVPGDEALQVLVSESAILVCSTLSRSVASLEVLNKTPDFADAVFNEAEVPHVHSYELADRQSVTS